MLDAHEDKFLSIIMRNSINHALLDRLPALALPDCHLVAGCLFQTVWNDLSGYPPEHGISDYDVFYCDCDDLSWKGEDEVIKRTADTFADLGVEVQVRNQARVHLWYERKYGEPCPPLRSSHEGIDSFLQQSSCFGISRESDSHFEVYAPFGFADLFDMTVRPNVRRNVPAVYDEKARRWCRVWPNLKVLPWPESVSSS